MKRPEPALFMIVLLLSTLVIWPLAAQAPGTEARCAAVAVSGTDTVAGATVVALCADSNACALHGHGSVIARASHAVRAVQTVAAAVGDAAAAVVQAVVRAALRAAASAVAAIV